MAETIQFELDTDLDSLISKRILHELADSVEMWSLRVTLLTRWEDENFSMIPEPKHWPDTNRGWKIPLGRLISWSTAQPEFPDDRLAANVAATMEVLADKLRMFHGPRVNKERADEILNGCGLL